MTGVNFRRNTRLSNASLIRSNVSNAIFEAETSAFLPDLRGVRLENANLKGTIDLSNAVFDETSIFNQWTVFPEGFDPILHGLSFVESPPGDFDGNGVLDAGDVDWLAERIRDANTDPHRYAWLVEQGFWDLNRDEQTDVADFHFWVHDLRETYFGDTNLNGQFDSHDLVSVFQVGQYEDSVPMNSNWATGDWNGDGEFDASDLVFAFQDGYEQAPRAATPIPEPISYVMLMTGFLGVVMRRRHAD